MRIDNIRLSEADDALLLTTKEVATILGITERTLKNWRKQGKNLKHKRLGHRTVRYQVKDIKTFINKQ